MDANCNRELMNRLPMQIIKRQFFRPLFVVLQRWEASQRIPGF